MTDEVLSAVKGKRAVSAAVPCVTFVVPARNEAKHIAACLDSIARLELPEGIGETEIIVVDNRSTDRTRSIAAQAGAQVVSVEPGCASRARNAGAQAATGDWLAFVDADCELPPDWLATCGKHLSASEIVAVGGTMRPTIPGSSWVERSVYALQDARAPRQASSANWLPGFNLLVRKQDFLAVGGFDESLVSCEDCEFTYRLADRGKLVIDPRAATAHHGESKTLRQLFRREAWRSHGNFRVALLRPQDWRNWISLALPVAAVGGWIGAAGALAWTLTGGTVPRTLTFLFLAAALAPFFREMPGLVRRNPKRIVGAMIVLAVYLAARTYGLFRPIQRVERATSSDSP